MRALKKIGVLGFLILTMAVYPSAWAEDDGGGGGGGYPLIVIYPQRQKERRQSRWTLDSWMKTKAEIANQNRWLIAHTNHVPMDFTIGWDLNSTRQGFEADYYIMKAGIRLRYEQPIQWLGSSTPPAIDNHLVELDAQIRLFGGNIQDTNLIFRGSYEYNDLKLPGGGEGFFTGFGFGPELQIYFSQWLGIRGDYKKLLSQETRFEDVAFSGSAYQLVGFLEMGSLRPEFGYRSKTITYTKGTSGSYTDSGLFGRIRVFF